MDQTIGPFPLFVWAKSFPAQWKSRTKRNGPFYLFVWAKPFLAQPKTLRSKQASLSLSPDKVQLEQMGFTSQAHVKDPEKQVINPFVKPNQQL